MFEFIIIITTAAATTTSTAAGSSPSSSFSKREIHLLHNTHTYTYARPAWPCTTLPAGSAPPLLAVVISVVQHIICVSLVVRSNWAPTRQTCRQHWRPHGTGPGTHMTHFGCVLFFKLRHTQQCPPLALEMLHRSLSLSCPMQLACSRLSSALQLGPDGGLLQMVPFSLPARPN